MKKLLTMTFFFAFCTANAQSDNCLNLEEFLKKKKHFIFASNMEVIPDGRPISHYFYKTIAEDVRFFGPSSSSMRLTQVDCSTVTVKYFPTMKIVESSPTLIKLDSGWSFELVTPTQIRIAMMVPFTTGIDCPEGSNSHVQENHVIKLEMIMDTAGRAIQSAQVQSGLMNVLFNATHGSLSDDERKKVCAAFGAPY